MGCQNSTLKQAHPSAATTSVAPIAVAPVAVTEPTATSAVVAAPEIFDHAQSALQEDAIVAEEPVAAEPAPVVPTEDVVVVKAVSPASPASPARVVFGERASNKPAAEQPPVVSTDKAPISFSEFLDTENAVASKRKVVFDAETMRKTAPKSIAPQTNLTKKQKEMLKRSHVSVGRRGPVSSKWGGKSQMQTDVYLEMAAAFERLLTNADTINAHLDSR